MTPETPRETHGVRLSAAEYEKQEAKAQSKGFRWATWARGVLIAASKRA